MKDYRRMKYYEFCPIKYDFVMRKIMTRKEFLRFFNFRVKFNEKVELIYYNK